MIKSLKAMLAIACAAVPAIGFAGVNQASCDVTINYNVNGALVQGYSRAFVIDVGGTYLHDFSTATRVREFGATATREANDIVVAIDYFNDVGVFNSVDLRTKVRVRDSRGNTVDGDHTLYSVDGTSTAHNTVYSLTCRRL